MNAVNQQPQQQMMNDGSQQMGQQQQQSQQVIPGGSQPRSQQVGSIMSILNVNKTKVNIVET